MQKLSYLTLIGLLTTPFCYANDPFSSQCIEEYQQGHLEKALYYCHGAATTSPQAQYILGRIYAREGIQTDEMKKAYQYFSAAAHQNHPEAQFLMSLCYQNGLGVKQNHAKAAYWYEQARQHGFKAPALNPQWSRAHESVNAENWPGAEELKTGLHMEHKDKEASTPWINASAIKGNPEGQYRLGLLYTSGDTLPQDDGKALLWLEKAASQNHSGAQSYLAWMSMLGYGKAANQEEAVQWYLRATQTEIPSDEKLSKNLDDLFSLLSQDTNYLVDRSAESEYLQGVELIESRQNPQDLKDGLTLLEKSAEENYPPAQMYLANLYHQGTLVERSLTKAAKYYTDAAYNGEPQAQYTLGWMYFYGEGVPQNNDEAFAWFNEAKESETKAKEAIQFIALQHHDIVLGEQPVSEPFVAKLQRAGTYLKSLLPTRKS